MARGTGHARRQASPVSAAGPDPVAWSHGDRGAQGLEGPAGGPGLGERVSELG